jgi:succinate-acetate transporter protein
LSWFFFNVIKNPFPLGFFGFSLSFMYLRHFNSWLTVGSLPSTIILY